jgi:hypothetical protein
MNTTQYGRLLPNGTLEIMPDKFKTSIIIGVKRVIRPTELQLIQANWKPIFYENSDKESIIEMGNKIIVFKKQKENLENGN